MEPKTISGWIRANVLGFIAIFIALGGTAAALPGTDTVESDDIIDGEVRNADIHANAVTSDKIGLGQVDSAQLHGQAVNQAKIADGAVGAAQVAPNALGGGQIDEASLDPSVLQHRLASGCAAGSAIRDVDAAGNVTCEGVGGSSGGPPTGPAGGGLAGNYPNPTIAADAVGNAQMGDNSVGSSEIANSAVGSTEIAANSVSGAKVQDGTLSGADISNDSVGANSIANTNSLGDLEINQDNLDIAVGKTTHKGSFCWTSFDGGDCATMTITLPRFDENVLMIASGEYVVHQFDDPQQPSDSGNTALMSCFLSADDSIVGSAITVGEKQTSFGASPVHDDTFPGNWVLTGITSTLSPGTHTLKVSCDKDDGDINVSDARLTAVTLD